MQNRSLREILGQPALHVVVALGFAVAFLWPIFVLTQPTHTFRFLYAAWCASIAASFALSRGRSPEQTSDAEPSASDSRSAPDAEEEVR